MANKSFFKVFRKKEKEVERGHREPIIVKFFKETEPDKRTNVQQLDNDETQGASGEAENKGSFREKLLSSQKYLTVCVYALIIIAIALVILAASNVAELTRFLGAFIKICAPFVGAALIAFLMTPIVNWVDSALFDRLLKIKFPKLRVALSIILSYIVVFGLLVLSIVTLFPQLGDSISELADKSGDIYNNVINYLQTLDEKEIFGMDLSIVSDKLSNAVPEIITKLTNLAADVIPKLLTASVGLVKTAVNLLLTIAISIYMVCDKRRIARAATQIVYAILPYEKANSFTDTSKECFQIFGGFIIGKTIDSLIIGILCFIILSILKLPYPVLVSVVVGITNMIPFFGPFIGAIPGALLYLCLDPVHALIFAIVILALQQFDGWVLGPMILGDSTGLRPIWVIFAITVGGAYFGVVGMFLGVPVTAIIVHLAKKALASRLKKKNIDIS